MEVVMQGRAMPDAKWLKDGKYYDINAVDVDPKQKDQMSFYCKNCKIKVIYVQGNVAEGSKPFFRKAAGIPHKEGCYYGKKKTLQDVVREIGTLDELDYGVKPPLALQKKLDINVDEKEQRKTNDKKISSEKPSQQRINRNKKHKKHLLTVDDLFHEIMDIRSQEPAIKFKLFDRLIGKVYFPYSEYFLIKKQHQKGKLKRYFFTAGKLNVDDPEQYSSIESGYVILHGKGVEDIKLRLHPYDEKITVQLKKLRYKTKSVAKKKYEFIGVKVGFRQISEEDNTTYIDLDLYEFDLNRYMN
ncbi:hypothetical protein M3596_21950 [Bacillus subtilis]|uniref:hypothetical protein n=1 Tax=Bacillus subtilis TaxID=1423 RepID=UPI00203F7CE5|nr:hypothetical protein [Bacillus subtilis]MCM3191378.1 hypothetical protein [Bacillus subtilis]